MIRKIIEWLLISVFALVAVMAHEIFKKLMFGRYKVNDIEYKAIELFGLLFVLIILGVIIACLMNG